MIGNSAVVVAVAIGEEQERPSFETPRHGTSGTDLRRSNPSRLESLRMPEPKQRTTDTARFERILLPHLDAAHNLARWLVRNPQDAEDVVQEAYLRAFKFQDGYQGGDARAWLLKIVRNTSYSFLGRKRPAESAEEFDETVHREPAERPNAEAALIQDAESRAVREALQELPANFREILILREFEGLSYKEIAQIVNVPIGTVMSGLARGRTQLRELIVRNREQGVPRGV
jgi:RNA polymerase sigma-70 factor, ECF subfamily